MTLLVAAFSTILCAASTQAQTLKTFLADKKAPLTYLGADFTQARYFGETALNETDFKEKVVPAMNDVIVNEPKKFDIAGSLRHDLVHNDLAQVTKHNAALDEKKLKTDNVADLERLKEKDIEKIAAGYTGKGVGLLFVVESLNKTAKEGFTYLVLIDLDTKKVLLSQRYKEDGKGFGLRNYWVHIFYSVLEDVDNHDYKHWLENNK